MLKGVITSFLSLSILTLGFAQSNFDIEGQITEFESKTAIPNTRVFLSNTGYGTATDGKGFFRLSNIPEGEYELVVTSEGFTSQKQSISGYDNLKVKIELKEQLTNLPQLVIESQTLSLGKVGMKEIPGSVFYISSDELRNYNYSNVNDIIKMIPGINLQEEDGYGLRPNIGLRGSGLERSARITIMEDGILAAPAPYASPSAYYFPTMGRMDGMEVLKGASQIRFGPFTTGGAINFLSTPIPNQFSGKVKLTAGRFGYRNLHAHVGNSWDQVGFLIETFQYGADGFKILPIDGDTGFDKKDYQVKFRVNTKPSKSAYQSLTFTAGQTDEISNETYVGLTNADFTVDPYQRYAASQLDQMNAAQRRLSAQHYAEIPGWFNVVTTIYRNDFERNWYKLQSVINGRGSLSRILADPLQYDNEFDILTGSVNTDTASLKIRANNREYYSQGIQTVFDFEFETGLLSHDIHVSGRFHEDEEDRFQWEDSYSIEDQIMKLENKGVPGSQANRIESASAFAGYIFYKLSMGKLSITPGLRYENVKISRKDFGKNDTDRLGNDVTSRSNLITAWLPGFGVNYEVSTGLTVFGGVHKGFAPGGSKPGTREESSLNYELGFRRFNSRIGGTVVLFLNDYDNLLGRDVAAAGGTGSGDVFNAGTALTKGLEAGLNMDFLHDENAVGISLPFELTYTFTDAEFSKDFEADFEEWGSISKGDELPYIAAHQLFMSLGARNKNVGVFINGKYQSDIRTTPGKGEILQDDLIADYTTFDLSTNVYFSHQTSLNLSVNNLFDNKYAVASRPAGLRPGLPRTFMISAKVLF